ncbi:alpha/beta hydrolase fold domain-containing protein [Lacisediminihabitans changchengi]|uniref:Alpha/beta hydrolase fold domain-containing protein n=1 Tax=Lacisediminihabitans changchengi TaxID=2787634 RepID=A0A934SK00_9MICO|nr:alpha/beta hydrolase [Lacisediminihabitans changchengi]MBK4346749.1 alpha/beta hydrolase fold domain-containing protein [Lacisediminihabitans changchengi]MBK4348128.1 alpha/beta hydrolase fold domain-containing protein [Lacisediminihabitans changchengi]
MQSLSSRLMPLVMTLRGAKRRYSSAELTLKRVDELRAHPASWAPPPALAKKVRVEQTTVGGMPVYTVGPRDGTVTRVALYLHGGSYVFQIQRQHWTLIADLAATAGIRFTVPIFPLAPEATASTIVPTMTELAASLITEHGARHFGLFGDSAGGGMALAVAQQLRDRGFPAPRATVLISPWLDISGTDPRLAQIAPSDPWLAVPGSHAAGELYRGDLPELDPLVSPIYGNLLGLGPITMFSGTRDILNADAHRLVDAAAVAGVDLDFHEAPGMIHVYPLLPIGEAKAAREVMRRAMR